MTTRNTPKDLVGILKELGPGLIIAGSIVGSGNVFHSLGFWGVIINYKCFTKRFFLRDLL